MENGVQTRTCPNVTVNMLSGTPMPNSNTSKATARMISGKTKGSMIMPRIPPFPGKLYRVDARAAKTPKAVDRIDVDTPTMREFFAAFHSAGSAHKA